MTEVLEPGLSELLAGYPPANGRLARALISLISDAFPELEPRMATSWSGVTFHHPRARYVACVMVARARVSLMFVHGRELEDAEGLLVDRGPRAAFMRFSPGDVISPASIVEYVVEAIALKS